LGIFSVGKQRVLHFHKIVAGSTIFCHERHDRLGMRFQLLDKAFDKNKADLGTSQHAPFIFLLNPKPGVFGQFQR
jgi:hypothetical protein